MRPRLMRKSPMFVLFVVLTLGFGIGANTTVFTVINTLILKSSPGSRRLAIGGGWDDETLGYLQDEHAAATLLPGSEGLSNPESSLPPLAGYTCARPVIWQQGGKFGRHLRRVGDGQLLLDTGLTPAAGRFFLPDEDTTPGAHGVAVLNYGTWQSRFGGAPDVLGKTLSSQSRSLDRHRHRSTPLHWSEWSVRS